MGTSLIDNFDYRGRRFLDDRQQAATLAALRAIPESTVPDGFRAYCAETGRWYEYASANKTLPDTGKWRLAGVELAQESGFRPDIPMSQKAITDILPVCANFSIIHDTYITTPSYTIHNSQIFDAIVIHVDGNMRGIVISGAPTSNWNWFRTNEFNQENLVAVTKNGNSIPDGAVLVVVNIQKSQSPDYESGLSVYKSYCRDSIAANDSLFPVSSKAFSEFKESLDDFHSDARYRIEDLYPCFIQGYLNSARGDFDIREVITQGGGLNYRCISLKVNKGDVFYVRNLKGGTAQGYSYAIYDKYGNKLTDSITKYEGVNDYIEESITIVEEGYITFNNNTSNPYRCAIRAVLSYSSYQTYIQSGINNSLLKALEEIRSDLNGYPLSVSKDWNPGFILTKDVSHVVSLTPLSPESSWRHTVIPCKDGQKFHVNVNGGSLQGYAYAFCDENMRIIENRPGKVNEEISAPPEAWYLILNAQDNVSSVEYIPGWKKTVMEKIGEIKESLKTREVNILCFGNSFTEDSMGYVPYILKSIAPELRVNITIAYIGGCGLAQHLANFSNQDETLNETIYSPKPYSLIKYAADENAWKSAGSRTVDDLLAEEWDIITFQQNGTAAYREWDVYYKPYIYRICRLLFSKLRDSVKLGWIMTHGAYAGTDEEFREHWRGTAENAKKVMEETVFSILFPYGTGVQNLRTTGLKDVGDGSGRNMTVDNAHIQDGIGCLVAAYTNALAILNSTGYGYKGVIGDSLRPDEAFLTYQKIPGANLGTSGVIGITDENCYLAQTAAELAIKSPYEVSDMSEIENNI